MEYNDAYNIRAEPIEELLFLRKGLFKDYEELVTDIRTIENQTDDYFYRKDFPYLVEEKWPYRIWKFKILLSEDGLLFLKNTTNDLFSEDIPDTYLRYANMPRIFKMAAVRVKHIFHKHYHHDANSDTFITLTNLNYTKDPQKIALEQIRGPLLEIVKAKRINNFAHLTSSPP